MVQQRFQNSEPAQERCLVHASHSGVFLLPQEADSVLHYTGLVQGLLQVRVEGPELCKEGRDIRFCHASGQSRTHPELHPLQHALSGLSSFINEGFEVSCDLQVAGGTSLGWF